MNFDNIDFNQKLNVLVITDLNDLANISFLKFDNKILTATSKGQLLCMKILNDSITWFHLNQLLNMRKYYSEI